MTEKAITSDSADFRPAMQRPAFGEIDAHDVPASRPTIAILGLGYVGLPTALVAHASGADVLGIDISESRLRSIRAQRVDLIAADRERLAGVLDDEAFQLTSSTSRLSEADAVIVCVPTPVDEHRNPDLGALAAACGDVVANARPGQTIILTSTSYPGTTRDLLVAPLEARGLTVGEQIHVAFSPERIDPGNLTPQRDIPRVVGGVTHRCTLAAVSVLEMLTDHVVPMSSPEAAEMSKLLENSFRAVNIAFANEMSDACAALGLDVREVIDAASTKPYGFMPFYPGTGVGGHCIPCDPHYLLWELRSRNGTAPILTEAMEAIAARPYAVVERVAREMSAAGRGLAAARVLVVGVAYKPGVEDVRESPAVRIVKELVDRDAEVDFYDPLVPSLRLDAHRILLSVPQPDPATYDAIVVSTLHPNVDYAWLLESRILIDPSGRVEGHPSRLAYRPAAEEDGRVERRVAESKVSIRIEV